MTHNEVEWATLVAVLRRNAARDVDLFVHVKPTTAYSSAANAQPAWDVWLEVPCARRARVCSRVHLWLEHSDNERVVCSQVQAISAHLSTRALGDDEVLVPLHDSTTQPLLATTLRTAVLPAALDKALTGALEQVVGAVVALFRASQRQALEATTTATNRDAQFDFELLVTRTNARVFASLTLALFPTVDTTTTSRSDDEDAIHALLFPAAFVALTRPTLTLVYALDGSMLDNKTAVAITVEWPFALALSQKVVDVPRPHAALSSIEVLAAVEQCFLTQWTTRKQFIRELRQHTIVLEFDAVDYARVVFVVQLEEDGACENVSTSQLQIVLLALRFTPAYFATQCLRDLELTLLDGGNDTSNSRERDTKSSVSLVLHAEEGDALDANRQKDAVHSVQQFLDAVYVALTQHVRL